MARPPPSISCALFCSFLILALARAYPASLVAYGVDFNGAYTFNETDYAYVAGSNVTFVKSARAVAYYNGSIFFCGSAGLGTYDGYNFTLVSAFDCRAAVVFGDALIVGGSFDATSGGPASKSLAAYDLGGWAAVDCPYLAQAGATYTLVSALLVANNTLFLAGKFDADNGYNGTVATWDGGSQWTVIGSAVMLTDNNYGYGYSIAWLAGSLYFSGIFLKSVDGVLTAHPETSGGILQWNQTAWGIPGGSTSKGQSGMYTNDNTLYIIDAMAWNTTMWYSYSQFNSTVNVDISGWLSSVGDYLLAPYSVRFSIPGPMTYYVGRFNGSTWIPYHDFQIAASSYGTFFPVGGPLPALPAATPTIPPSSAMRPTLVSSILVLVSAAASACACFAL